MNHSAIKLLNILELFGESNEPLTISDISRILGYPKTSVFDIVHILEDRNYIQLNNKVAKTYTLGYKSYQIGMNYMNKINIYSLVHPILLELNRQTHETCYLAVRNQDTVIYLDKVEADMPFRTSNNIGSTNHLYLTGLGKALLATMSDDEVRSLIREPFEIQTDTTLGSIDVLIEDLHRIRCQGYAFDNGESTPWLRCFAVPLREADGSSNYAISIAMLSSNYNEETAAQAIRLITNAGMQISRTLGFCGSSLF